MGIGVPNATLSPPERSWTKTSSDESHFNASLIVRDKDQHSRELISTPKTSHGHKNKALCVDSARALLASFCLRFVRDKVGRKTIISVHKSQLVNKKVKQ